MNISTIILGNYGNETVALMQWCYQQSVIDKQHMAVVSIDTGWASPSWSARVAQGEAYAKAIGMQAIRLQSKNSFAELVKERASFPNRKYQWCPGLLKGLPLLTWLDEIDPACEAVIVLGKRRAASRTYRLLPEIIEESELHGDRKVWHPLYSHSDAAFFTLIEEAGFDVLHHRSLECDPCIFSTMSDLKKLNQINIEATKKLEEMVQNPMYLPEAYQGAQGIEQVVQVAQHMDDKIQQGENFDWGCGSHYGCGY